MEQTTKAQLDPGAQTIVPALSSRNAESSDQGENEVVSEYLSVRVPEYRRLSELRRKGWESVGGDKFFHNQKRKSDRQIIKNNQYFYKKLIALAKEIHEKTGAFGVLKGGGRENKTTPAVMDLCMAPGGFLQAAVDLNPNVRAVAYTLPTEAGGHKVLMPSSWTHHVTYLDITMLIHDVGVSRSIPDNHPDAANFLPKCFQDNSVDLVICDGQVLRTHPRPAYREPVEATRLICTQLILGLKYLREGGTMIIYLHRIEGWESVKLLYIFDKFAKVQVYKPRDAHQKRSSFYAVITDIKSKSAQALEALEKWWKVWEVATFDMPEELRELRKPVDGQVQEVLDEFGRKLIKLGRNLWRVQADGLQEAPFMKN